MKNMGEIKFCINLIFATSLSALEKVTGLKFIRLTIELEDDNEEYVFEIDKGE